MNNKYYRITCNNIGIYEYLKKYLWNNNYKDEWNAFIKSDNVNWLKKPHCYKDESIEYYSYFNKTGYEFFVNRTLPLITKWIDKNIINTEIVEIEKKKIIYQDKYQIVVEKDKI